MSAIKQKTCKVCREKFTPRQPMATVCSLPCAQSLAVSIRGKAEKVAKVKERKADAVKRDKLKSRSDWQREAQTAVNAFVRARDAALPCISCGRHHGGQYHAGHYRSVGSAPHLRFDVERNIFKQCQPCNTHLHGNLIPYRVALIERIGLDAVESLECDQAPRNYTVDDLKTIKTHYAARVREMKRAAA